MLSKGQILDRSERLADLDAALRAQGIPMHGVRLQVDGSVEVDYAPEATGAHRTLASAVANAFDWTPKTDPDRDTIEAILAKGDANVQAADLKPLLLALARKVKTRGGI